MRAEQYLLALLAIGGSMGQFRPEDHSVRPNLPDPKVDLFSFTFVVELRRSMSVADGRLHRPVMFDESDSTLKFMTRQTELNTSDCSKLIPLGVGDAKKVAIADGLPRNLLLVNGKLPGPTILVNKDATVEVLVVNRIPTEVVSIHWHGQTQNGTAWMDGSSRVAQCDILPGQTFRYRFIADNTGTHWWHASIASQTAEGLYGPLIVIDQSAESPHHHEFEAEFIAVVQDLFHSNAEMNFSHQSGGRCDYAARSLDGTELGTEQFPSVIVNGRGWYNSPKCSDLVAKPWLYPLEVFHVAPGGKRYLFRVIGANTVYPLKISIDYHSLHVVTSDGNEIAKVVVDFLIVHAGERYDFYITTNNDSPGNQNFYWMRVATIQSYSGSTVERREAVEETVGFALVQYGTGDLPPSPTVSSERDCVRRPCRILNCPYRLTETTTRAKGWTCVNVDQINSRHIPDDNRSLLAEYPDKELEEAKINFVLNQNDFGVRRPTVNGYNFVRPFNPPGQSGQKLSKEIKICSPKCLNRPSCDCSFQISLAEDKVVQLVISNSGSSGSRDANAIPFHLPGHQFYVVKVGWPEYEEETNLLTSESKISVDGVNLKNPPLKDTVIVPAGGYVVLRFVADNPGWWLAGTTLKHLQEGMSFLINEGKIHPGPPAEFPRCSAFLYRILDGSNDTDSHADHSSESEETAEDHSEKKQSAGGTEDGDSDEDSAEKEAEAKALQKPPGPHPRVNKGSRLGCLPSLVGYSTLLLSQSFLCGLAISLSMG